MSANQKNPTFQQLAYSPGTQGNSVPELSRSALQPWQFPISSHIMAIHKMTFLDFQCSRCCSGHHSGFLYSLAAVSRIPQRSRHLCREIHRGCDLSGTEQWSGQECNLLQIRQLLQVNQVYNKIFSNSPAILVRQKRALFFMLPSFLLESRCFAQVILQYKVSLFITRMQRLLLPRV